MRTCKIIVFIGVVGIFLLGAAPHLLACDLCLVLYPDAPCVYHYDTSEYFTVKLGDPLHSGV